MFASFVTIDALCGWERPFCDVFNAETMVIKYATHSPTRSVIGYIDLDTILHTRCPCNTAWRTIHLKLKDRPNARVPPGQATSSRGCWLESLERQSISRFRSCFFTERPVENPLPRSCTLTVTVGQICFGATTSVPLPHSSPQHDKYG